jgi:putative FmdB family regulatory protein
VSMPIFEYACDDCGTHFERLVRRSSDAEEVRCPSCGQDHLTTQYSTFAARSGFAARSSAESTRPAPAAGCGGGMCQGGMCGMDVN